MSSDNKNPDAWETNSPQQEVQKNEEKGASEKPSNNSGGSINTSNDNNDDTRREGFESTRRPASDRPTDRFTNESPRNESYARRESRSDMRQSDSFSRGRGGRFPEDRGYNDSHSRPSSSYRGSDDRFSTDRSYNDSHSRPSSSYRGSDDQYSTDRRRNVSRAGDFSRHEDSRVSGPYQGSWDSDSSYHKRMVSQDGHPVHRSYDGDRSEHRRDSFREGRDNYRERNDNYNERTYSYRERRPRQFADPIEPNCTIGLFGLSFDVTPEDFEKLISSKLEGFEGKYTCKLIVDRMNNRCKGFGFVKFGEIDDSKSAKPLLETDEPFMGKSYQVAYSIKQAESDRKDNAGNAIE